MSRYHVDGEKLEYIGSLIETSRLDGLFNPQPGGPVTFETVQTAPGSFTFEHHGYIDRTGTKKGDMQIAVARLPVGSSYSGINGQTITISEVNRNTICVIDSNENLNVIKDTHRDYYSFASLLDNSSTVASRPTGIPRREGLHYRR